MLLLENKSHQTIEKSKWGTPPLSYKCSLIVQPQVPRKNGGLKTNSHQLCTTDLLFHRRKAISLVKSSRPDWATWGNPVLKSVFWAMEPDKGACHQAWQKPVFTPLNLHGGRRINSCTLADCTVTTQVHTLNKWNEEKRILIFQMTK